jgi:hypothetical protein
MTIVFALLLPVMALMYFDLMDMKAQIRAEAKDLRRLKKEMQQEIQQVKEK